jgi:hypothetical protein
VAVVLNSERYADDAASLLDYAFADKSWSQQARPTTEPTFRLAALRADLGAGDDTTPATIDEAAALLRGPVASAPARRAP